MSRIVPAKADFPEYFHEEMDRLFSLCEKMLNIDLEKYSGGRCFSRAGQRPFLEFLQNILMSGRWYTIRDIQGLQKMFAESELPIIAQGADVSEIMNALECAPTDLPLFLVLESEEKPPKPRDAALLAMWRIQENL
jgi:hypothetical protein